jgi:glycyl-tRNA synthetase
MAISQEFVQRLGVSPDNIFFEEKLPHERAHYAQQVFDQMVKVSRWGWIEVSGHAYRTNYDLSRHQLFSGVDLSIFRRYEKPLIIKKRKILLDKNAVLRIYGEEAPRIFRELSGKNLDELATKIVEENGYIIIDGVKYNREIFKIEDVEEKIYGERIIPHVVEPSFGAERLLYITLDNAYVEEVDRVVLKLPKEIAPIQVAVLPLLEREDMIKVSKKLKNMLIEEGFYVLYDESGSIGRRYARADEIGVPYAVTIDHQTLSDETVTVRFRDTKEQIRIKISELAKFLEKEFKK